jgi:hypothetical protein
MSLLLRNEEAQLSSEAEGNFLRGCVDAECIGMVRCIPWTSVDGMPERTHGRFVEIHVK